LKSGFARTAEHQEMMYGGAMVLIPGIGDAARH
jgi:hypothetical protein